MSERLESKGIEELAKNVDNPDDAAELIKKMDYMIKSKKNNILLIAYHQSEIFKRFKTNKFVSAVSAFKIRKITINFKTDIVKFIDMYPKMQTSCISLHYLKTILGSSKKSVKNMPVNFNNIFLASIFILKLRKRCDFSLYLKN